MKVTGTAAARLALVLLLAAWGWATPSFASETGGTSAVASGHGVRLELRFGRSTYPRDGLIRARLQVTNRSHRFMPLCGFCASPALVAEVLDGAGRVVYPAGLPDMPEPYGPPPSRRASFGVPAGKTVVTHQWVVLSSDRVRATVRLGRRGERGEVETPALRLNLVSEPPPVLHLELQPRVAVHVEPPVPVTGPLLYTVSYRCRGGISGGSDWVATVGRLIAPDMAPDCAGLLGLHLIAGWSGHRVGRLDYVKRYGDMQSG